MTTERLTFSKMSARMKPQRYPYTLESLQRWAKWQRQLQASGLPVNSESLARQLKCLPAVYGLAGKSWLSFPDTTGPSREPSLPSNANQGSTSSPGTPAAPAASSKTSTMTPPSMTPPSQSIADILSGWMADAASGDTGPNGVDAEPDGEPWGTCDWGYCNGESVAWRFSEDVGTLLPVCQLHIGPPTGGAWPLTLGDIRGRVNVFPFPEPKMMPVVCHGAAAWLCTIGHGHVCS